VSRSSAAILGRVGQQLVEVLLGMQEAPVERVGVPDELLHHSVVVGGEVVLRELPNAASRISAKPLATLARCSAV
jgi:hypothetical protein